MKRIVEVRDNVIVNEQLKDGFYNITGSKARNPRLNSKYWQYCHFLLKHCLDKYDLKTKDMVHEYLKLKCGHVDIIEVDGVIYKLPRSINFESCSEEEMSNYFSRALDEGSNLIGMRVPQSVIDGLVSFY